MECTSCIRSIYNRLLFTQIKYNIKNDRTVVTEADIKIESYFITHLENREKDVYVIGEETIHSKSISDINRALKTCAWIIDPIDGTSCYVAGIPLWGITLGFIKKGI